MRWVGLLLVLGGLLVGWAGSSQAESTWAVRVTGISGGPTDTDLASMTWDEASQTLGEASAAEIPLTLPAAPENFPALDLSGTELDTDGDARTMVLVGSSSVLEQVPARVAVVADWDESDDADAAPTVTVSYRADQAPGLGLGDIAPALDAVPVGLSEVWLTFRRDGSDTSPLAVHELPQAGQDFFDNDGSDDEMAVGRGVALRAVVDRGTEGLGTALRRIGARSVQLDGTLSTSDDVLAETASAPQGFSLSASVVADSPASLPDWLALGESWELALATDGAGELTVALGGGASLDLGGASPVAATAGVEVTSTNKGTTTALGLEADEISGPFGADWLTLDGVSVAATLDGGDLEGELSAGMTVSDGGDSRSGTVDIALASSGGDLAATLDAALDGSIGASDLASLVGGDLSDIPAGSLDPTIGDLALHLAYDASAPGQSVVSATGTADVAFGGPPVGVTALVRSGPDGVLIAARPDSQVRLSDLIGTVDPDPVLPDLAVNVSSADFAASSDELDEPTRAYFAPLLCDGTDACAFDLDVPQGVGVLATITLPDVLLDALGEVGIDAGETLVVTGLVPSFGGTTTELAVQLPELGGNGGKFVRDSSLDLRVTKRGGNATFGLDGAMTLGIPRTESDNCPSGIYVGNQKCIDEVTFSLSAQLAFSDDGVAFELLGGLDAGDGGWKQPFGMKWLTLHEAKLKLAVTAGAQTSVDIGFLGRLEIGETDLTVSGLGGVTPNAPFIVFKGFTAASKQGVGMKDLALLYGEISNTSVNTSALPPVGVRNLFLSIGTVTDEDLCIREGFYLAGDLVLDRGGSSGDVEPGCLPPEGDEGLEVSEECERDGECLASVMIDVQTGNGEGVPSVNAAGYVTGWKAGPMQFDPTKVELSLDDTGGRVFIQGGATLLDPVKYASNPQTTSTWASGQILVEISTSSVMVDASVSLADALLEARVKGKGALSLTRPDFVLKVYFKAAFLDDIGEAAEEVFNDIGNGVDDAVRAVDAVADDIASTFTTNNPEKVFSNLQGALNRLGRTNSVANWKDLVGSVEDVRREINKANDTLQDWGFGRPIPVNALLDAALFGVKTPDIPKVRECGRVFGKKICVTIIPAINIPDIPGACSGNPFKGTSLCTRKNGKVDPNAIREEFADPAIEAELDEGDLELPSGASTTNLVDAFRVVEPPADAEVTCAASEVSYPAGNVGPTVMDVETMGTTVTIEGPAPGALSDGGAATDGSVDEARQEVVDALVTGSEDTVCSDESAVVEDPTLTLSLGTSVVDEGAALIAQGKAVNGKAGDLVTVGWGDGSTSQATVTDALTWSATHRYADGGGSDNPTSYTVSAQSAGYEGASRRIVVANVAPTTAELTTSGPVDEGGTATLTGRVVDPGAGDTHTVSVDWGDGSAPEAVTLAGQRLSASHRYADDPAADTTGGVTQADDIYPVTVTVADSDGDSTQGVVNQRVDNVPPALSRLAAPTITENDYAALTATIADPGVEDIHTVSIDWGDGSEAEEFSPEQVGVLADTDHSHQYLDDGTYVIAVTVTDDDGGSGTAQVEQVVQNAPPVVETLLVAPIDEGDVATLTGTFIDVGTLDTHTVTVDWGDGSGPRPVALDEGGKSFSDSHAFPDDNPTGTSQDLYEATVVVSDDDGGTGRDTVGQQVRNVAPHDLVVTPLLGLTGEPGGTLFSRDGQREGWTGVVRDPGLEDELIATIDWGDGATSQETLSNDGSTNAWAFYSAHAWSGPALLEQSVSVTDDDTGASETVTRWVVVTRSSPARAGGPGWWATQTDRIVRGKRSELSAADLAPYLGVARHVSATFGGDATALRNVGDASSILSGPFRGSRLAKEQAKAERALLVTLLDFVHGERAWDDVAVTEGPDGGISYGALVAKADAAMATGSVRDVREVRQQLGELS